MGTPSIFPLLTIRIPRKSPTRTLAKVNLNVKEGEFLAVMGKSDSGKPPLFSVIGILESYDRGTCKLQGVDVGELKNHD